MDTNIVWDFPMHLILWGTYDLGKPRTRILRQGLRSAGVKITEIHVELWKGQEDKSQVSALDWVRYFCRLALAYPGLIARYLQAPSHDAVLIPYLGQFDAIVLWPFARLRRKRIVLDLFLSLYDTVTIDRKLARPNALAGWLLWVLEWSCCRIVDLVLLDTRAHAHYVAELFRLHPRQIAAVPVGVEPHTFPRLPPRLSNGGPARILFYGQLIPLHGVGTIVAAALSDQGRRHRWHLVGSGQGEPELRAALSAHRADHVTWEPWVDYESLIERIADADICLGIFGASRKAASVVPNKVYQALSAGRSIITRDSPAIRELVPDPHPGLRLVPDSDPVALLRAIDDLACEGFPVVPQSQLVSTNPHLIGHSLRGKIELLCGLRRQA